MHCFKRREAFRGSRIGELTASMEVLIRLMSELTDGLMKKDQSLLLSHEPGRRGVPEIIPKKRKLHVRERDCARSPTRQKLGSARDYYPMAGRSMSGASAGFKGSSDFYAYVSDSPGHLVGPALGYKACSAITLFLR